MSKTMKFTISVLLVAILSLAFGAGFELGNRTRSGPAGGLDTVGQAWDIIFTDYVERDKLDAKTLSQAAIKGMIEVLDDPYTSYLDAQHYQLDLSSLEGAFDGIGANVTMEDDRLTIIAPIADSPAAKAGIRAGDIILEINGEPASGLSLAEAVMKIRGPSGTSVRLLVLHQNETDPEEIEIVRAKIELSSVYFEMKEAIAYINITQFSENTDEELSPVLEKATEEEAKGIILDLRSNPGGLLETVVNVVSHFLHDGIIVKVAGNQENFTLEVEPGVVTTDLPMVVLTDNFSASGSEVLAGALQDYGRAPIAGTKTFGKGSVNVLRPLKDGSGLYITTARWFTPNGHLIEGRGITPDYELELTGDDTIQWAIDYLSGNR